MKRVALIVSLLCCVLSASAQNAKGWSLIPYAKVASSIDFLYGPYESKFHGDLGVDVKYDFNEHWSLLGGIDYQYRRTNSDKPENWEDGVPGTGFNNYFRLPVRVEFSYKWFYVNAGPYVERAVNPWLDARTYEHFGFGGMSEIGGRIKLTENSRLRLGLQFMMGHDRITYKVGHAEEHWTCLSFIGLPFSVGYEIHL